MRKQLLKNPYLSFPLAVAGATALIIVWSTTQSDRSSGNQPFLVLLLLSPLAAAVYSGLIRKDATWLRRIGTWVGTMALGFFSAVAVFALAQMAFPPPRVASNNYNSSHFRYSDYAREARQRTIAAGQKAVDQMLYTLDAEPVLLSDLWSERPIVLEFGAVT